MSPRRGDALSRVLTTRTRRRTAARGTPLARDISGADPTWKSGVVGWDVGALTLITLAWSVIVRDDSEETQRRASGDDPGRHVVFGVALLSSVFSFFAAAFVLRHVRSFEAGTTWAGS